MTSKSKVGEKEVIAVENSIKDTSKFKFLCRIFGHKLGVVGTLGYGENLYCRRCGWEGDRKSNFTY